jgi:hypothetical protein
VADQLYLSLWFPNFRLTSLAPALVSILHQLTAAGGAATVSAAAAYPLSWNETPAYQRIYEEDEVEAAAPEVAVAEATHMLHDDFAYEFEMKWDLWTPETAGGLDTIWRLEPRTIRIIGFGPHFEDGFYEQNGHIRVDLGTDTAFLQEDVDLDEEAAAHVQQNVERLVSFTNAVQANALISTRLLWSESGENLAEKLIQRLQRLN